MFESRETKSTSIYLELLIKEKHQPKHDLFINLTKLRPFHVNHMLKSCDLYTCLWSGTFHWGICSCCLGVRTCCMILFISIVKYFVVIYTRFICPYVHVTATRWPGPPFQLLSVAEPIHLTCTLMRETSHKGSGTLQNEDLISQTTLHQIFRGSWRWNQSMYCCIMYNPAIGNQWGFSEKY